MPRTFGLLPQEATLAMLNFMETPDLATALEVFKHADICTLSVNGLEHIIVFLGCIYVFVLAFTSRCVMCSRFK